MDASGVDDGTDFRPFFDMVIGILFVLLILVAAQVYFQQAEAEMPASEAARRAAALRRADIAAFLGTLAGRLHAGGLDATVDPEAGTVLLPLGEVVGLDGVGLPSIEADAAGRLGGALSTLTTCVTLPRSAGPDCPAFGRLALDALAVTARVGALPPRAALARDRFGDLASALLSARVLNDDPALIGASSAAGGRVIAFDSTLGRPAAAEAGVGGDLVLGFTFR